MLIIWFMFHNSGIVIFVLIQRNQFNRFKLLKTNKYQIEGFTKYCSTKTTVGILEKLIILYI